MLQGGVQHFGQFMYDAFMMLFGVCFPLGPLIACLTDYVEVCCMLHLCADCMVLQCSSMLYVACMFHVARCTLHIAGVCRCE